MLNCGRPEICQPCEPLNNEQRLSVCFVVKLLTDNEGSSIRSMTHEETINHARDLLTISDGDEFKPETVYAAVESAEKLIF